MKHISRFLCLAVLCLHSGLLNSARAQLPNGYDLTIVGAGSSSLSKVNRVGVSVGFDQTIINGQYQLVPIIVARTGQAREMSYGGHPLIGLANGINDAGDVVGSMLVGGVTSSNPRGVYHGFYYHDRKLVDLGADPADTTGYSSSSAAAINNRGEIILNISDNDAFGNAIGYATEIVSVRHGVIQPRTIPIPPQLPGEIPAIQGYAINDLGEVALGIGGAVMYQGFVYSNSYLYSHERLIEIDGDQSAGPTLIPYSAATSINNHSQVLCTGHYQELAPPYSYRYANFIFQHGAISPINAASSSDYLVPLSINNLGQVVGYDAYSHLGIYDSQTNGITYYNVNGGNGFIPYDINDAERIVGLAQGDDFNPFNAAAILAPAGVQPYR